MGVGEDGPLKVFFMMVYRYVATILLTVLGAFLFGMIGSMTYPGIGALVGGALGICICGCFGCTIVGLYKEFVKEDFLKAPVAKMMPGALSHSMGLHSDFSMILTVHEVANLSVKGRLFGNPDTFVEVTCGTNPKKCTCVRSDAKFNERFKLKVRGQDTTILLRLMDQNLFGSTDIAYVVVRIREDILADDKNFPVKEEFHLMATEGSSLRDPNAKIVLSFEPGDDFSKSALEEMDAESNGRITKDLLERQTNYNTLLTTPGFQSLQRPVGQEFKKTYDPPPSPRRNV